MSCFLGNFSEDRFYELFDRFYIIDDEILAPTYSLNFNSVFDRFYIIDYEILANYFE